MICPIPTLFELSLGEKKSGMTTVTTTITETCNHDTGWYCHVTTPILRKRIDAYWCEKCRTLLYGKELKKKYLKRKE